MIKYLLNNRSSAPKAVNTQRTLFFILLIAFVIRLETAFFYEEASRTIPYFGYDESVFFSMALNMLKTSPFNYNLREAPIYFQNYKIWSLVAPLYVHPPVFVWTYMVFQYLLGSSFLTGRILNVIMGMVNIYTIYLIGKKISPGVGILSASFLAVTPLHIQQSAFVLSDMMLAMLVTLFILYVLRIAEKRSIRNLVICGIILGLGLLTKYHMALALPILFLYVAKKKISYSDGIKVLLLGGVIFSFWLVWSLRVYDLSTLWSIWQRVGKYPNVKVPRYAYFTFLPIVAPFSLLSYISVCSVFKDRGAKMGLFLIFFCFAIIYTAVPNKEMRYLLPVLPPLAVLSSDWVLTLKRKYSYPVIFFTIAFSSFASYRIVSGSYFWYLDFWYYKNWYLYFLDPSTPMIKG